MPKRERREEDIWWWQWGQVLWRMSDQKWILMTLFDTFSLWSLPAFVKPLHLTLVLCFCLMNFRKYLKGNRCWCDIHFTFRSLIKTIFLSEFVNFGLVFNVSPDELDWPFSHSLQSQDVDNCFHFSSGSKVWHFLSRCVLLAWETRLINLGLQAVKIFVQELSVMSAH